MKERGSPNDKLQNAYQINPKGSLIVTVCPISTPTLANEHLLKLTTPEIDVWLYHCVISTLMYLMLGTHLNLTYIVAALGRHTACPGNNHQCTLDCAFCYIQVTGNWKLIFQHSTAKGKTLHGFVDTNWATNVNNQKLMFGYIFLLARAAISWSSKKQSTVAVSSTEAEYIAVAHAVKELIWL